MLAAQVHGYLRAPGTGRRLVRIGPFTARLTPNNPHPMRNYAIPDDGARPSPDEILALVEAFCTRGLAPRLEYVAEAVPHLEPHLVRAGFTIDDRLPLMACPPGEVVEVAAPEGIDLLQATSAGDHADAIRVADIAYGEPPSTPEPVALLTRQRMTERGAVVVLARDGASGQPAGSGIATVPRALVSEVAGIGTHPDFRGRGVAAAVTSLLARRAFERGVELVWLTPGHDGAARVYERIGFRHLGAEMIHATWRAQA